MSSNSLKIENRNGSILVGLPISSANKLLENFVKDPLVIPLNDTVSGSITIEFNSHNVYTTNNKLNVELDLNLKKKDLRVYGLQEPFNEICQGFLDDLNSDYHINTRLSPSLGVDNWKPNCSDPE